MKALRRLYAETGIMPTKCNSQCFGTSRMWRRCTSEAGRCISAMPGIVRPNRVALLKKEPAGAGLRELEESGPRREERNGREPFHQLPSMGWRSLPTWGKKERSEGGQHAKKEP